VRHWGRHGVRSGARIVSAASLLAQRQPGQRSPPSAGTRELLAQEVAVGVTIGLVVAGLLGAAIVGVYLYRRGRARSEEPFYHFRCPGCRRRLRFRGSQSGHSGQCSHCGKSLTFPPLSQAID
jgi:hypothetical protein